MQRKKNGENVKNRRIVYGRRSFAESLDISLAFGLLYAQFVAYLSLKSAKCRLKTPAIINDIGMRKGTSIMPILVFLYHPV